MINCLYCGKVIDRVGGKGRYPVFCCNAHTKAYYYRENKKSRLRKAIFIIMRDNGLDIEDDDSPNVIKLKVSFSVIINQLGEKPILALMEGMGYNYLHGEWNKSTP